MSTGEDDPLSGLNGRLRPRKSLVSSSQNKALRKSDGKTAQDRPKRTSTPSKASPNQQDDLPDKSDFSSTPQFLCPYCDKKFASKQTVSKHVRRMHLPASKQDYSIQCLFCNHSEAEANIIRHMVDSHPNQYFACLECHTRFPSTSELAEHKLNVCEKQKVPYRNKLRQKGTKRSKKSLNLDGKDNFRKDDKEFQDGHGFNGIVISCELKPSQVHEEADIEDNITTNLILPPNKNLGNNSVIEKSTVIMLDEIQWNKRIPPNFSFQNTDPDQILSRLGVVHRSPRTNEYSRRDWIKAFDECTQKFERCFDTNFYSKVAGNVQENLSKFLDGSFNFNPDPDNTIKTRKPKNIINAVEGFPILLACEQYSRSILDGYLPRAIAPKHKWKWDNLDNEKNLSPDQIRRNSHINNCIVTLVSNLDIWTQLCMRRKFEDKFNHTPPEKKTEKQNIISKELKQILESRELPTTSQVVVKHSGKPMPNREGLDFPASLGLTPSAPRYDLQPAVLSGEWVRPRCYVCCACGSQTRDPRAFSAHMSNQHPNANVQHYEIVGEPLLNADILKHLYVPPNQMSNRTRPLRGFRDCTKCNKSISLEDLHQHMLDCAGDTPAVRRRQSRPRPFGVRRRRPRLPDNTIRKKIRKDIRSRQRRQKSHMRSRPRPRPRSEVGDAETIRKMIADLPAKRHRVLVNPVNMLSRPHRKLEQRTKLILKKRPSEDPKNRRRIRKETKDPKQGESTKRGESSREKSLKQELDDEDNKPLRPKIKRVIGTRKLPHNSVNRKTIMKRAKRRSIRVEQRKSTENSDAPAATSIGEIPTADTPQRIDVNRGPYNTREHANRGGSNRREDQRPGCSGSNGNANNYCAPAQNVPPLKHSIARLTANSETHDKSVQFHHSFLVQQECNNTNQHLPSGQHTLFENEAVVTKLDKPPLQSTKGPLDLYPLQKSKLNKPRKGLNDCIAMLKNKLGPETHRGASTSHISVQCGSDEPIDVGLPPRIINEVPVINDSNPIPVNSESKSVQTQEGERYFGEENEDEQSKNLSILPTDLNISNESTTQSEPIRKRSTTHVEIEELHKIAIKFSPEIEIIPMQSHTENEINTTKPVQKPQQDYTRHSIETVIGVETSPNANRRNSICLQSEMNSENTCTVSSTNILWQNSLEIVPSTSNTSDTSLTKVVPTTSKTSDTLLSQVDHHTSKQPYNLSNDFSENMIPQTVPDVRLECRQIPLVSYTDTIVDIPTTIPPAHANSSVDSPLDLSSKIFPMSETSISQDLSVRDGSCMVCNYEDTYATLDLSNKATGVTNEFTQEIDTVVDLRVKPNVLESSLHTLDLSMNNDMGADLSVRGTDTENEPTDLSIRGRRTSMSTELSGQIEEDSDIDYVQDLSTRTTLRESECNSFSSEEYISPTDLSTKNPVINYTNLTEATDLVVRSERNSYDALDKKSIMFHQQPEIISKESNKCQETPLNITQSRVTDKSSLSVTRSAYNPSLKMPQFKTRCAATNEKSVNGVEIATIKPMSKPVGSNSVSLMQDPSHLKVYSIHDSSAPGSTPPLVPSAPIKSAVITIAGVVPEYMLPTPATTLSIGKLETIKPVYALGNTCISVTKIEPSVTALTNSLPSIAGTSIASTTPAYTLANTTDTTPEHPVAVIESEIGNNSTNREYTSTSASVISVSETFNGVSASVQKEMSEQKKTQVISDMLKSLTPDKAQNISVLPDHIKLILANMQPDHRNELMNVLPPFPSIMSDLSLPSGNASHTMTSASSDIITSQIQHAVSLSNMVCSASTSQQAFNTHLQASKLPKAFVLPITSASAPLIGNEAQAVDQDLRVPKAVKEESNTIDTDKYLVDPSSGVLTSRPNDYNSNCVIDLTEDENVPTAVDAVKVAEELSQAMCQEQPVLPVPKNVRQKSNDQTASLRAVRIKAPSERHKEIQMLKRVYEEQKPTLTKIDIEDNGVNLKLESGKLLAVQQDEISTTMQCNKNVPSVESDCITVPTQEHSSAAVSPVKSHVENLGHNNYSGNKSSVVNSCLNANEKNLNTLVKQSQDALVQMDSKCVASPESLEAPKGKSSKVKILKENSTDNVDVRLQSKADVAPDIADTKTTLENNDNKNTLDDEDSEDDVSLAIIVRNKQLDEQNRQSPTIKTHRKKHSHKLTSGKKKKKEKQSSKTHTSKKLRNSKNQEAHNSVVTLTDPSNNEVVSDDLEENDDIRNDNKNTTDTTESPHLIAVDIGQQSLPNIDKDKRNCTTHDSTKLIAASDVESVSSETLQRSDRSSKCDEDEIIPQSPLIDTISITTIDKECTEAVKVSVVELQQDIHENENLDETNVSTSDLMQEAQSASNVIEKNEIRMNEMSESTCATSITEKSVNVDFCEINRNKQEIKDIISGNSANELCIAQESIESPSVKFEKDSSLTDDKNKAMRSKKTRYVKSSQIIITNDSPVNCDVDESVALPLRRSRRGKTIFVDSILPDHENSTIIENPVEKTPLTKKQLIFSKLLLDEENHNKCPEAIVGNQTIVNDSTDVVLNTEGPSNAINNYFEPLEKSRPTKRKNSPQLKRKSKKKRNLDLGSGTQYETSTVNSDHVNQQAVDDNTVNTTTDIQLNDSITGSKIDIIESGPVLTNEDLSKKSSESPMKFDKITKIEGDNSCSTEDSCNKFDKNKLLTSAEKRKLSNTAINLDSTPKQKKTKLDTQSDEIVERKKCANIFTATEIFSGKEPVSYKAFAARRTRSKSVIVKSSNSDFYDPYDIDLEDVPEKAEPFRKTFFKCKDIKGKNSSKPTCTIVSAQAIEAETLLKDNTESSKGINSRPVAESVSRTDNHDDQDDVLEKTNGRSKLNAVLNSEVDDNLNDSDDSSKSDVPLKRYVEGKGKRLNSSKKEPTYHTAEGCSVERNDNNCNDESKKNVTLATAEISNSLSRETEEQLRSEQFMESFGFFSERKPRKSNLLASKKISETFHIIANESDDVYFGYKERTSKKRLNENRKSKEGESTETQLKTNTKRGRKKKSCTSTETCYCYICKKQFRRPDNYLRHQMTLLHISKLSEVELRVKTVPVLEEPNYLIPYKQQLDRLKILTRKLAKQKKNSKSKIKLPTLEEILENVNKTVREQQLSRTNRSLSRDEALFIDCCELLKESHRNEPAPNPEALPMAADVTFVSVAHCSTSGLEHLTRTDTSDGDVDSITAKTILESEEVRNLENDLISGLKEAAEAANAAKSQIAMNYQHTLHDIPSTAVGDGDGNLNIPEEDVLHCDEKKIDTEDSEPTDEIVTTKQRKYPEIKEKMYPDIEGIDMFEDKFDKIKRKCRSQAAAAKHMQPIIESSSGYKGRKKSDKKKGKRCSKKNNQNTVLTKGALKGYDGVKVSIPTSEVTLSAIAPPTEAPLKKKKKCGAKKKRDKRESESNNKYDCDTKLKDNSSSQKKVDVYEFMDNEDVELFEFRPSTLMERFKSMSNKEMPSTSKTTAAVEEKSSESASDGDDFVYMSDDYLCSDDETENSLMSCEFSNMKIDAKKNISALKRKDVVEKNAVMGKIFKHNAVRSEKKSTKGREVAKPKANLDQLFDSLLEEEPSSSLLYDADSVHEEDVDRGRKAQEPLKKFELTVVPKPRERVDILDQYVEFMRTPKKLTSRSPERAKEAVTKSPHKYDIPKKTDNILSVDYEPSTSSTNQDFTEIDIYGPSTSKTCDRSSQKDNKTQMPKRQDYSSRKCEDSFELDDSLSKDKMSKSIEKKCEEMFNKCVNELDSSVILDDAGVARQRARRKCTVGKQNVLAETWSSESEPDGFPPRPNSAESVVVSAGRKKKSRKKDGQHFGGRRGKQTTFKKQDIESRVTSSNRNTTSGEGKSCVVAGARVTGGESEGREFGESSCSFAVAGPSTAAESAYSHVPPAVAGPSGWKGRQRSATYYWSSEGDEEQEHLQQHGWIVGDSHKKLVTMLAHAKGRKRHNDEKRHSLE